MFLFFKSLHVIGFVSWFAGLFYLGRIFVYLAEARAKDEPERGILTKQFQLMATRVYRIICMPAMIITWTCGLFMLGMHGTDWLSANPWMYIKLSLLGGLSGYQFWCGTHLQASEHAGPEISSFQFRLLNEVPTLFLVAISLLAVYRNTLDFLTAAGGLLALGIVLYGATKGYRKYREKG